MNADSRTTTTPSEAIAISAICFGWAILASAQSVAQGFSGAEFSDRSFIGLIVTELVLASIALTMLHARRYAVVTLFPMPSLAGAGIGVILYALTWLASWLLTAPFSSIQVQQPIGHLVHDAMLSLPTVVAVSLVNGNYEEIFLLGFLVRGLRGYGPSIAIGASLLVRLLYHLYQGPLGALSVLGFGAVLSIYYVRTGALFPVIFAHVLADVVPFMVR